MILQEILLYIKNYIGEVQRKEFILNIKVNTEAINKKNIAVLYFLLNRYENLYFITLEDMPYCIMADAIEHIIYQARPEKNYYHDTICRKCELINKCPGWQKYIPCDRKTVKPVKNMPKEIVLTITTDCALNCKACQLDRRKIIDMDFETAKELLNEAKSLGIKRVRFTGGEPSLNRDIEKILYHARKNKFYVIFNTNAVSLSVPLIKTLGDTVDNVLVSLQGFNQKTDAILTGQDNLFFKKIGNLLKLKMKIPSLRVGTIISKILLDNFEKYYLLLERIGIHDWDFYRPIVRNNLDEFKISKKELRQVCKLIFTLKKRGMEAKIANPLPFCIIRNMPLALSTLSGAEADDGHSRLVWDTKGYFKPSYFIDEILGKNIKDAWYNPFLQKIRSLDFLPSKCRNCKYVKWCKGGSRAAAKLAKNNYFAKDPLLI